jgi:hypothetical protein
MVRYGTVCRGNNYASARVKYKLSDTYLLILCVPHSSSDKIRKQVPIHRHLLILLNKINAPSVLGS